MYRYRKEGRFGVIVVIFAVVGGGDAGVAITEGKNLSVSTAVCVVILHLCSYLFSRV